MPGGWSELTQAQPQSSCQLANLLAGFPGWLSLQVAEAVLILGAFPDIGEGAKKTRSPQRCCPWGWYAGRLRGWGFGGGVLVLVGTAERRVSVFSSRICPAALLEDSREPSSAALLCFQKVQAYLCCCHFECPHLSVAQQWVGNYAQNQKLCPGGEDTGKVVDAGCCLDAKLTLHPLVWVTACDGAPDVESRCPFG